MAPSAAIQVVVRLRPMNEKEKKHGTLPVVTAKTQEKTVTVIKGQGLRQARSNYSFDNVFTAFSNQGEVFDSTLKPMISDVMQGYESTVFAYGQTGTGKTHTMEGDLSSPEQYGIIPRSAQAIFEALKKPEFVSHNVVCTYLEIYNEELCDLLLEDPTLPSSISSSSSTTSSSTPMKDRGRSSKKRSSSVTPMKDRRGFNSNNGNNNNHHHGRKLEIMNGKSGTFCRGLTEKQVRSASDVLDLMQGAQQLRRIGETKMNKESSRSHCVFTIIINANRKLSDGSTFEFSGKLHMVDLAGSECAKSASLDKSSVNEVARERERMNINRSLLTLGRVIQLLKEQSSSSRKSSIRIPYRDSKLTRILQESLGGRCKTLIIATLSPSITAIEESLSTLNYAQAANGIVNRPVSSSYLSLGSSAASCSMDAGSTEHSSVEHWQEMECRLEYMQTQVEEAKAALARKHIQEQELRDRAEKAESAALDMENKYVLAKQEVTYLKDDLAKEKEEKEAIRTLLRQTEVALKKNNAILEATQHTEKCLTAEAKQILDSLDESIRDSDRLHHLLTEARQSDTFKRNATKKFHAASISVLDKVINQLDEIEANSKENQDSLRNYAINRKLQREKTFSSFAEMLEETKNEISLLSQGIQSFAQDENGITQILAHSTLDATKGIEQSKLLLSSTEGGLRKAFDDARIKNKSYLESLEKRNCDYLKCSEEAVSAFESNISTAKANISRMVSKISGGLNEVKHAGTLTRRDLSSMLYQIEETSKSTLSSIETISSNQKGQISSTLEKFGEGKKHLGDMTNLLKGQNSLMENMGTKHLDDVDSLQEMMRAQRTAFEQTCIQQKKLQEEVLKNMYEGMQQLLQTEIKKLHDHSTEQQSSFNISNEKMLSQNDIIGSSVRNIFGEVQSANGNLLQHVKSAQANDNLIEKTVHESNLTFTSLENLKRDEKSSISSNIASALGHITALDQQQDEVTCTIENMVQENKNIEAYISSQVIDQTRNGLTNMCNEGQSHIKYAANTIVANTNADLERMEAPRDEFCTKVNSNLNQIASNLNDATKKIYPIIEEQCKNTESIQTTADTFSDKFKELSTSHCNKTCAEEESLVSSISRFEVFTIASSCNESLSETKKAVHTFSIDDIQSEEISPPLAPKTMIKYSSHLSSTPNTDIIVQGLNLSSNGEGSENSDATSVKSDSTSVKSDSTSVKSEISSQSSTGMSITQDPSPLPLSDMSINNIDKMTSRQSGLSKKPIRQSKKRSNSRQRAELRKRIPTTPSRVTTSKRRKELS